MSEVLPSSTGLGRERGILAALFGVALIVRLAHWATILDSPFFSRLALDPLAYDEWGMRIAAGAWLGERIFYQDPLYPYFLGALYSIFGHSYLAVVLVQIFLGALVPVLVFKAARDWVGRGAALTAAGFAALYAPAIYYEGLILKAWMEAFFMAAVLWSLSRAVVSGRNSWWAWTGAFLGLGCLVRANFLLLIPLLAAWILIDRSAHARESTSDNAHPGRGKRWHAAALFLAGAACILVPCAVRNRLAGGEWVLTTSQGGQNFFLGNHSANQSGEYVALPFVGANPKHEERGFAAEAERRTGRPMRPTEVSRFWFREGFVWIGEHPGDWLRLLWKKARVFWAAYEVPDNLDYYLYQTDAPILRLPLPGFGFVVPLGIVGAVLLVRRNGWPRAVLAIVAVYSASVILFYVFARYRLGMMPALFPCAGWALVELARSVRVVVRGEERARTAALALGTIAAFSFVNLPVRAPADYWTYRFARTLGLPAQAATTSMAHFNRGVTYAKEAKEAPDPRELLGRAEAELREALRQDRDHVQVYLELGKVLARQRRDAEAIELYEAGATMEPRDWRTHHALGILYRRAGRIPDAEGSFKTAAQLEPRQSDSAVALGELLLDQHRLAEAADAFRAALRASPENESARKGLDSATR